MDVGREKHSELVLCRYRGEWRPYAWTFSKKQVRKKGRTLVVYDRKALEILRRLKEQGELRGYKLAAACR
ncbi:MAG: hypothetical protein ACXQT6_00510 [Candidatus Methanospirareceae archaeon]